MSGSTAKPSAGPSGGSPATSSSGPSSRSAAGAAARPVVLLLIGVHREEAGFCDAVAARVDRRWVDLLRVPRGLPQRSPPPDQAFRYQALHDTLYRQVLDHAQRGYRLLIDLHSGHNAPGRCADAYAADPELLQRVAHCPVQPRPRPVLILPADAEAPEPSAEASGPVCHTTIPARVWAHPRFAYLGLEVYLPQPGTGTGAPADWTYTAGLIDWLAQDAAERAAEVG